MFALTVFSLLGIAVLVAVVTGAFGPTKNEKSVAARRYADWLNEVYPNNSTVGAAGERYRELLGRQFVASREDEDEMKLCVLVIEGWHTWNGARV